MGSNICEQFSREQVVYPPKLHGNVFTAAAVDNIDHNPSSTTSKESFHGTGISLFQHPTFEGEGVNQNITAGGSESTSSKSVDFLQHFYTDVPPVTGSIKKSSVPAGTLSSSMLRKNISGLIM